MPESKTPVTDYANRIGMATPIVNRPEHYTAADGTDVLDFLRKQDPVTFVGFCRGNIIKYAIRAGRKDRGTLPIDDIEKIIDYARRWKAAVEESFGAGNDR